MSETTHRLDITISRGHIDHRFSCSAEAGAKCRLVCREDCEEWSWNHEADMLEGYIGEGVPEDEAVILAAKHRLVDGGECKLITFISEDEAGLEELYEGEQNHRLRSGPVNLTYDGDYVAWAYAKEVSA